MIYTPMTRKAMRIAYDAHAGPNHQWLYPCPQPRREAEP